MKISRIIILFLIILYSCSNNGFNIGHSHLDEQYRLLEIDYNNEPDESLTQIIRYSNIRKEGYGVLLNIEMATPKKKLQSIIDSFRKEDINAVHVFNIEDDSIPINTIAAINGASFTWFLDNDFQLSFCKKMKAALIESIDQNGIIVIENSNHGENIKKCLDN